MGKNRKTAYTLIDLLFSRFCPFFYISHDTHFTLYLILDKSAWFDARVPTRPANEVIPPIEAFN
jgi:hypothetical protein